ncbi:Ubiquitin carboxyl-terminal hydrolase 16 [Lunasporangiospora selenospora]|uniref:ubiquitinyl hydrolase 1 n=1 Tax=Lunasporangiospora selenospora TaxID=979761 RepID=A0A9P6FRU6_9FUNG|nr:Ubiquitin carboxyl-terminal hydrolase 16 [Lunasporangiospora selenospora]
MAKKKKGARRISHSEFADDDKILREILTGSGVRANAQSTPIAPASSADKGPALESSPLTDAASMSDVSVAGSKSGMDATTTDNKCQHVKDSVKVPKLRKNLSHIKDWDHCQGCQAAEIKAKKLAKRLDASLDQLSLADLMDESAMDPLPADSLWLCLNCCEINCGRAIKQHGLAHHGSKGHDHALAINLASMDCWCYNCDDQVVPSKNKNQLIQECQNLIEKAIQTNQRKIRAASDALTKKSKGATSSSTTSVVATVPVKAKVLAPGLQNLGNTCFFNSVMQVLSETKSLKDILSTDESRYNAFAESLAARTDAGLGPLTSTFKDLLESMNKQKGSTIAPRDLFLQITRKWKMFRGFRQQDSHELMRYLFDGIKQEEMDIIKRKLADEAPSETKTEQEKANGKENGSKEEKNNVEEAPKFIPFIDSCFSGKLVSVIVCDTCKKCSYAPEDFFDLSLPVRGPTQAGSLGAGSSLKARLLAQSKTASSEAAATPSTDSSTPSDDADPIPEADKPSEQHLRHVERLLKPIGQSNIETLSILRSLSQFTSVDVLDGENKFACENCFKLIQVDKAKQKEESSAAGSADEPDKEPATTEVEEKEEETKPTEIERPGAAQDSDSAKSQSDSDLDETLELTDRFGNTVPLKSKASKDAKETKSAEEVKFILRKGFKRYLVSSLPPTLVFHLKRFEQSGRFGLMRKIEDFVEFPAELDMGPYFVPKKDIEDEDEDHYQQVQSQRGPESKKYRLYGAVVHMGTLGGGHYTNYVLSSRVEMPELPKIEPQVQEQQLPGKEKSSGVKANGLDLPDVPLSVMLAQQKGKKKKQTQQSVSETKETNGTSEDKNEEESDKQSSQDTVEESSAKSTEDQRQWIACSDTSVRLASLDEVLSSRPYLLFYERCY